MSEHESSATPPRDASPSLWRNRTFLRFFAGQFVTNAGDSLYAVAILWLLFELSGSTVLTGLGSSLLLLPFLLQIIAGPLVDRFPVKPLLVGSQVVQGVVVLLLPAAAITDTLSVALLIATIPVLSLMTLVVGPARATLVPRIVPDGQLAPANSALTTVTNGLDMIFDALGGAFIALFGTTVLFVFDSLTFAVASLLFLGMRVPRVDGGVEDTEACPVSTYVADLRAGIDVLRGTVFVEMILTAVVANFALGVTLAILPAFGALRGGPAVYGLLLGALGTGRVIGSAIASSLDGVPYGRFVAVAYSIGALLWVGTAYVPSPLLAAGLFCLAWVPGGVVAVLTATLNQKVFPADLLGRVSSIKGTASTATLPLGSLVGGFVAAQLGTTTTMALSAFGFGFVGLYFALRPPLRRLPAIREADPAAFDVETDSPPAAGEAE